MSVAVFYLSRTLANTNKALLASNERILGYALCINADAREFERIRFESDHRAPAQKHIPQVAYMPDRFAQPPVDGSIPLGPNGEVSDYSAFERGAQ
jgi:hypothetical protein